MPSATDPAPPASPDLAGPAPRYAPSSVPAPEVVYLTPLAPDCWCFTDSRRMRGGRFRSRETAIRYIRREYAEGYTLVALPGAAMAAAGAVPVPVPVVRSPDGIVALAGHAAAGAAAEIA